MAADRGLLLRSLVPVAVATGALLAYAPVPALQRSSDPLPTVRAAIGERADTVRARSTHPVRFPDDDLSTEVVEAPVVFDYADPKHGFQLPPTRYVWMDQGAGRIYSIQTTPQLEAAPWRAARALTEHVVRIIDRAGWPRAPLEGQGAGTAPVETVTFDDVQEFFSDSAQLGDTWSSFRTWRSGEVEINLNIRRLPFRGSPPLDWRSRADPPGLFLVTITIESLRLSSTLHARVYAKRDSAGGALQSLAAWLREDRDP